MEQTERIMQMERCLDRASQAVKRLSAALDEYADAQDALRQLSDYYGSDAWILLFYGFFLYRIIFSQ